MSKIATSLSNAFTALDRFSARALHRQLYNQLREAIFKPSDAGMHLIGWLSEGVDDRVVARAALAGGVEVTPLSAYCIESPTRGALRLGYTGYTPRQIWGATRQLAQSFTGLQD